MDGAPRTTYLISAIREERAAPQDTLAETMRLLALSRAARGTAFEQHPAFERFTRAEQEAVTQAERTVAALSRRDWDTGTPAFTAASEAMTRMLAAADELIASQRD